MTVIQIEMVLHLASRSRPGGRSDRGSLPIIFNPINFRNGILFIRIGIRGAMNCATTNATSYTRPTRFRINHSVPNKPTITIRMSGCAHKSRSVSTKTES